MAFAFRRDLTLDKKFSGLGEEEMFLQFPSRRISVKIYLQESATVDTEYVVSLRHDFRSESLEGTSSWDSARLASCRGGD